ncbi:MAG: hypothetical protein EU529_01585 [Promethearchaeota archaeon]|nr:MAG: hypothetical protein EU529_01585 [Candidatus Lokiarchaeota archaeon]
MLQKRKWNILKWDKMDPKSYEKVVDKAARILKEILNSGLRIKLDLDYKEAPTKRQLVENDIKNYNGFVFAYSRNGIKYNDIIKAAGLTPNHESGIWDWLNVDTAANKLLKILNLPFKNKKSLRDFLKLKYNEAPTRDQLKKFGYSKFIHALKKKNIKYSDIIKKAGLEINKESGKWDILDFNSAKKIFLNIINSPFREKETLRKFLNFGKNEAPSTKQLRKYGYRDFILALYRKGISYIELIESLGLIPHRKDIEQDIGYNIHWILELIFLQFAKTKDCFAFYEFFPNIVESEVRIDNAIIRKGSFIENIESKQRIITISKKIKIIIVEYYSGSDQDTIMQKCRKGYQSEERFLIIVLLSTNKSNIKTPHNIRYMNNVKILNAIEFSWFMGYDKSYSKRYLDAIKLAREAHYDKVMRNKLRKLAINSKVAIKSNFNHRKKKLENFFNKNEEEIN